MSGYNLPLFTYSSIVTQLLLIVKSWRIDLSHLLSILYHSQPQPKTLLTNVQFWGVSAGPYKPLHVSIALRWCPTPLPQSWPPRGNQELRTPYLRPCCLSEQISSQVKHLSRAALSLLRSLLPIRAGSHLPENLRGFLTASTKLGQTYLIFYVGVSLKVVLITQKYTFMFCHQHKTKDRAQLCDIKMYWIKNITVKSPSGCMNKIENVQNMSQKINWCYLSRKLCSPHCRCISSARALFMWRLAVILLLPMFCGPPAGPVPSNWPRCMGRGKGEMEGVCYV